MPGKGSELKIYIVYLESEQDASCLHERHEVKQLAPGLFFVATPLTQSRLYHSIKRQLQPSSLLVGELASTPKFKGLREGALKWVRTHGA